MLDNVFVLFRKEPNRIQMQTADGLRNKRNRKYKPVIWWEKIQEIYYLIAFLVLY